MRKVTTAIATTTAAILAGVSLAAPAQAADTSTYTAPGCPTRVTSPMLADFGDDNEYFEVSTGAGSYQYATGWIGSFGVTSENEPWHVNPRSSVNSLSLYTGANARTPDLCMAAGEETFRFFYRGTGSYGSQLTVKATIKSSTGTYIYNYRFDASGSGWRLSPTLSIPNYSAGGTQTVSLQFTNTSAYSTGRAILVDDVLVDPWRSRGW